MTSNLSTSLFVLSLVLICELIIALVNTVKGVCKPYSGRGGANANTSSISGSNQPEEHELIFKIFYSLLYALVVLTIGLYLAISVSIFSFDITGPDDLQAIGIISFYYMPTIFMVLLYVLLYYQIEKLKTKSHIMTGQEFRTRLRDVKLGKILKTIVFVTVSLFMASQIIMMVLTLFTNISLNTFYTQLWACTLFIAVSANSYIIFLYFRMAGRPYVRRRAKRDLKHYGFTLFLWNVGFIVRFSSAVAGVKLYTMDSEEQDIDMYTACMYALVDFFALVIPIYAVIDRKFVSIFSLKHLHSGEIIDTDLNNSTADGSSLDNSSLIEQMGADVDIEDINITEALLQEEQNSLGKSQQTTDLSAPFDSKEGAIIDDDDFKLPESLGPSYRDSVFSKTSSNNNDEMEFKTRGKQQKHSLVYPTPANFQNSKISQYKEAIEKRLMIQEEELALGAVYTTEWYKNGPKSRKNKLGSLYACQLAQYGQTEMICRDMKFDRITSYQLEGYFTELARLHMLKLSKHIVFPKAVLLDENNTFQIVTPKFRSLFETLHADSQSGQLKDKMTKDELAACPNLLNPYSKLLISIQVAKLLNTFHSVKHINRAHGHLSSHNVFVKLPHDQNLIEQQLKVYVGEFELTDLAKYATMFYQYRSASVWSAPEILKKPKQAQDPQKSMDVYSFGIIMWEMWHECIPFDADVKMATNIVCQEQQRPAIQIEKGTQGTSDEFEEDDSEEESHASLDSKAYKKKLKVSAPIAELIRQCWQEQADQRPTFSQVLQALYKEKAMYSLTGDQSDSGEDSDEKANNPGIN